jgi:hypothetical protein
MVLSIDRPVLQYTSTISGAENSQTSPPPADTLNVVCAPLARMFYLFLVFGMLVYACAPVCVGLCCCYILKFVKLALESSSALFVLPSHHQIQRVTPNCI